MASCNFRKNVEQSVDKRNGLVTLTLSRESGHCLLQTQNKQRDREKRAGRMRGLFQNENLTQSANDTSRKKPWYCQTNSNFKFETDVKRRANNRNNNVLNQYIINFRNTYSDNISRDQREGKDK